MGRFSVRSGGHSGRGCGTEDEYVCISDTPNFRNQHNGWHTMKKIISNFFFCLGPPLNPFSGIEVATITNQHGLPARVLTLGVWQVRRV